LGVILLIPGSANAAGKRLHVVCPTTNLGLQYVISHVATVRHFGQFTPVPHGDVVVEFYATVRNTGTFTYLKKVPYSTYSFALAGSRNGKPYEQEYGTDVLSYPQINGGDLRKGEKTSGWFGYDVPKSAHTVYLRIEPTSDPNDAKVVLTYHP
jgi:hypothetical protein